MKLRLRTGKHALYKYEDFLGLSFSFFFLFLKTALDQRCMVFFRHSALLKHFLSWQYFFGRTWCGSHCGDFLAVSMRLSSPPDLWTLLRIVLLFNAMGCIQSIRCKPKSFRDSIIVLEVNSSIDPNPTSIDESSSVVLRYRTPHFRACARVLVPPLAGKETWTIGWIQACNHMEFYNTYGNKGMWVSLRCGFGKQHRWWACVEHIWLGLLSTMNEKYI